MGFITKEDLISFEKEVKVYYEDAKITAPIHLTEGNEDELTELLLNLREIQDDLKEFQKNG